jgi:hypothetical protein
MNYTDFSIGVMTGLIVLVTIAAILMCVAIVRRARSIKKKIKKLHIDMNFYTEIIDKERAENAVHMSDMFRQQQDFLTRLEVLERWSKIVDARYANVDRFLDIMGKDADELEKEKEQGLDTLREMVGHELKFKEVFVIKLLTPGFRPGFYREGENNTVHDIDEATRFELYGDAKAELLSLKSCHLWYQIEKYFAKL